MWLAGTAMLEVVAHKIFHEVSNTVVDCTVIGEVGANKIFCCASNTVVGWHVLRRSQH